MAAKNPNTHTFYLELVDNTNSDDKDVFPRSLTRENFINERCDYLKYLEKFFLCSSLVLAPMSFL